MNKSGRDKPGRLGHIPPPHVGSHGLDSPPALPGGDTPDEPDYERVVRSADDSLKVPQDDLSVPSPGLRDYPFCGESLHDDLTPSGVFSFRPKKLRKEYPRRIILIRHAQSVANVDYNAYVTLADHLIPITEVGRQRAVDVGVGLESLVHSSPSSLEDGYSQATFFYYSPYLRSKQTFDAIADAFRSNSRRFIAREEPRLREQEWGPAPATASEVSAKVRNRRRYGAFYYRIPGGGESGADVNDRVTLFMNTLFRRCEKTARRFARRRTKARWMSKMVQSLPAASKAEPEDAVEEEKDEKKLDADARAYDNIILVSHGYTIRCFLARWFHWSVEQMDHLWNPHNLQVITLERHVDDNAYRIRGEIAMDQIEGLDLSIVDFVEGTTKTEISHTSAKTGRTQYGWLYHSPGVPSTYASEGHHLTMLLTTPSHVGCDDWKERVVEEERVAQEEATRKEEEETRKVNRGLVMDVLGNIAAFVVVVVFLAVWYSF